MVTTSPPTAPHTVSNSRRHSQRIRPYVIWIGSMTVQNVHIWLGTHSLRATSGLYTQSADDITGIDYDSSNATSVSNAKGITVPLVIISNTGHYFVRPDEILYDMQLPTIKRSHLKKARCTAARPVCRARP